MNKYLFKITLLSSLFSTATITYADDSEIFFNEAIKHVKPNVIFLLDGSGSMAWDPNPSMTNSGSNNVGTTSRIELLKKSLDILFNTASITGIRAGMIRFSNTPLGASNGITSVQQVIDIDETNNPDLIAKIGITKNGSTTTLNQVVLSTSDDGFQEKTTATSKVLLTDNSRYLYTSTSPIVGYRFNGILLKPSSSTDSIVKATLRFNFNYTAPTFSLYVDPGDTAPYFSEDWNFFSNRLPAAPANPSCTKITGLYVECDVTSIIQSKINSTGWKAGNAIAFYIKPTVNGTFYFSENTYVTNIPRLIIEAKDEVISDTSVLTNKMQLTQQAYTMAATGGTYIGKALYETARYISDNGNTTGTGYIKGPVHFNGANNLGSSPILEGCQLSHIILMTDGEPSSADNNYLATYMGQSASSCRIFTDEDATAGSATIADTTTSIQLCARAFVSWLSRTDQSTQHLGANYIRTNAIGFAMPTNGPAKSYLEDIALYGQGKFFEAKDANGLVNAFQDIINDARNADSPSGSGQVTLSAESRYNQRTEIFYALYASDFRDYWSGNMKRFGLKYIEYTITNGSTATRPILVGKDLTTPAMGTDGIIKNDASSFWANSNGDGGKVGSGGTLGMLMYKTDNTGKELVDPTLRTIKVLLADNTLEPLEKSYSSITTNDLKLPSTNITLSLTNTNADDVKTGLLDFIRGYTYAVGGSNTPVTPADKKIGDSAKSAVTLINYSCAQATANGKSDITSCQTLNQVALLASNDGFLRGYDTSTGTALYEIMPAEMLPHIKNLGIRKPLNFQIPRSYGLDGTAITYLTNNTDYVGSGKAYTYIAAGRGGKLIYAFDITDMSTPKTAWDAPISPSNTNFTNLGYTWSTPVLGKIRSGGNIIPVLVFGGGYDKAVDDATDDSSLRTTNTGNAIYIVNAINGTLIQKIQQTGMNYSIPSRVALVTDDGTDNENNQKLITNIIVGDTGGQLWRFSVNNGASATTAAFSINAEGDNGIIAKLAGSSTTDARRFLQTPAVSINEINGVNTLIIGMGSGNRVHPISQDVKDNIYLLKYPLEAGLSKVLTEDDLAVVSSDGQTAPTPAANLDNGFMIKLSGSGEKVVSDGIVAFDRIVFNTYTPTPTNIKTCKPSTGTQRTYNYDTTTGISLLQTAFDETSTLALPPDVTYYCDSAFCTIIAAPEQLADGEDALSKGKNGKDPWVESITSGGHYMKAGWTDIFNITP